MITANMIFPKIEKLQRVDWAKLLHLPALKTPQGRLLVEHCPVCKHEIRTVNAQCKDQRFHV